ncbi:hypothetical protein ABZ920_14155 [Streptomyces sp. NPDC046831]|uniref:hypothetical protein n=1 Tax=Streptomyces sp. NPDC046831 TaxID=3154805 RepID=UPI003408A774
MGRADAGEMLRRLMQAGHTVTLERLPGLVAEHAVGAGPHAVAVFAVDVQETVLTQITGRGVDAADGGERLRIDGNLAGPAYQRVDVLPEPVREGRQRRRRWVGARGR